VPGNLNGKSNAASPEGCRKPQRKVKRRQPRRVVVRRVVPERLGLLPFPHRRPRRVRDEPRRVQVIYMMTSAWWGVVLVVQHHAPRRALLVFAPAPECLMSYAQSKPLRPRKALNHPVVRAPRFDR
jgi:hypothetical protein